MIGLTKSVAADFIRDGIRCNAIAPGTFRSPSWEDRVDTLGKSIGSKDKALEMFVARQPMGRVADAAEIAPIAVYLAGDEFGLLHRHGDVGRRRLRAVAMDHSTRNAAIAAAVILGGFGLGAFYMPTIMIAVGNYSTVAAGIVAVAFVAAFFLVFWLRGRSQRRGG